MTPNTAPSNRANNTIRFLPAEMTLVMPEQRLTECSVAGLGRPVTSPRSIWARRSLLFLSTGLLTLFAAYEMYEVLLVGGLTALETAILVLFAVLFAWVAFSFVSTVVGFILTLTSAERSLGIDPNAALPVITSRNALLLPTYNEAPHRVFSRLQAVYESIASTDQLAAFDFFILSDTTDPDIWILEEASYLHLLDSLDTDRIFYRHRRKNVARKSGNISEWISRFGGSYDHMIVLDADSLMTGDTVVRLAHAMEQHKGVGLIQTLPILVNGTTLFARVQQFAGRVYGPIIARGIAWWHGAEGNYWGHNAIIRVKAFADHAGLPLMLGPKPFGGHILSHDFVEAALMRRAGWAIHMTTTLGGSYEECPPSLTDYVLRDRRWCQGNIQHLGVLPARGLHWVSRLHLLTGIGSYMTSPMWLMFLLIGIFMSLQAQFIRPEYFTERSLFPQWPAQDPIRSIYVFIGTMAILFAPKLLGYIATLMSGFERRGFRNAIGGFASVLFESLLSGLMAPTMMLMQSRAVVDIALGRDSGWQPQRRDDGQLTGAESLRTYLWPTIIGALLSVSAYLISWSLFLWMTPVLIGLILAAPIATWTSSPKLGSRLKAAGILLTREESEPPPILLRANKLAATSPYRTQQDAFLMLATHVKLLCAHRSMVASESPPRRGDYDLNLLLGQAKVRDAMSVEDAIAWFGPGEKFAVLSDLPTLTELFAKPLSATGLPREPAPLFESANVNS